MSFIIFPISLIYISIRVYQSSSTISFIVFPVSLIDRKIWPNLFSFSTSNSIKKLSNIFSSIFHKYWSFINSRFFLIVIFELSQLKSFSSSYIAVEIRIIKHCIFLRSVSKLSECFFIAYSLAILTGSSHNDSIEFLRNKYYTNYILIIIKTILLD